MAEKREKRTEVYVTLSPQGIRDRDLIKRMHPGFRSDGDLFEDLLHEKANRLTAKELDRIMTDYICPCAGKCEEILKKVNSGEA